jgi:predicted RNA-binding protein with PUA-like domain
MNFLFKEEPSNYSFDDLVRDGKTSWTGVRNPLAQKHLRSVQKGDRVFFYHTGDQKAVDVGPVKKLAAPVTLAAVKADKSFASFPLVRMSRLSVMPVSDDEWDRIEAMSRK